MTVSLRSQQVTAWTPPRTQARKQCRGTCVLFPSVAFVKIGYNIILGVLASLKYTKPTIFTGAFVKPAVWLCLDLVIGKFPNSVPLIRAWVWGSQSCQPVLSNLSHFSYKERWVLTEPGTPSHHDALLTHVSYTQKQWIAFHQRLPSTLKY